MTRLARTRWVVEPDTDDWTYGASRLSCKSSSTPGGCATTGDWGSTITEQLARSHCGSVFGIHLTDVPFWHLFQKPKDLSADEQRFCDRTEQWQRTEGRGGHFAAMEQPELLADDIRTFFRRFRSDERDRPTAAAGASAPRASRSR